MRQIFSVRFFAAVGGVVGLFFLLTTVFATREVIEGGDDAPMGVESHAIDFVDQVFSSRNTQFALTIEGVAANDTDLIIDGSRSLRIVSDTPGVNHCPRFPAVGACAVVADLLGEGVVWFALVPSGSNRTVDLPAIDTLDDGVATLVNGWQLPFAPVLDRRCPNEDFASYRDFREAMGDDFTSIYDIDTRRLVAVECRNRVDYAPEIADPDEIADPGETVPDETVLDQTVPDASLPAPSRDPATQGELTESIRSTLAGRELGEAVDLLERAGWVVRTDDLDDPTETFTADFDLGRVTVGHRDAVVETVGLG